LKPPLKLIPLFLDILKVIINDLSDLPFILRGHIIREIFLNIKMIPVQPILALHISFSAMNVDRFIPFV